MTKHKKWLHFQPEFMLFIYFFVDVSPNHGFVRDARFLQFISNEISIIQV